MMSWLQALIMGVLQGLTEFLPVSSSAHLKLAKLLLGMEGQESLVLFDLICHLGTLTALLLFLRKDIFNLLRGDRKTLGLILLGTLPLFPFYFLLKPLRDWASQTPLLGIFLLITAGILFAGSRLKIKRSKPDSPRKQIHDVLWIGTMQAAALIPGISRSASTISCAKILGWEAKDAVRFSFLLSIPTILGGNSLELLKLMRSSEAFPFSLRTCAIGFLASCGIGLLVIRYAIGFLEKGNLKPFAWYCLFFGLLTTLLIL
jgi:undecaprenyl-diphosphatase